MKYQNVCLGMSDQQGQRAMARKIDALNALQIMSSIKQNTQMLQPKINDYMSKAAGQDLVS